MTPGTNVLAMTKGHERYIFFYDDASAGMVRETLGRFAADMELSFTWYDAALLAAKARRLEAQRKREQMK